MKHFMFRSIDYGGLRFVAQEHWILQLVQREYYRNNIQ